MKKLNDLPSPTGSLYIRYRTPRFPMFILVSLWSTCFIKSIDSLYASQLKVSILTIPSSRHTQFRSELTPGLGFSAGSGANMGQVDVDNPVGTAFYIFVEHHQLLVINHADHPQKFLCFCRLRECHPLLPLYGPCKSSMCSRFLATASSRTRLILRICFSLLFILLLYDSHSDGFSSGKFWVSLLPCQLSWTTDQSSSTSFPCFRSAGRDHLPPGPPEAPSPLLLSSLHLEFNLRISSDSRAVYIRLLFWIAG